MKPDIISFKTCESSDVKSQVEGHIRLGYYPNTK